MDLSPILTTRAILTQKTASAYILLLVIPFFLRKRMDGIVNLWLIHESVTAIRMWSSAETVLIHSKKRARSARRAI